MPDLGIMKNQIPSLKLKLTVRPWKLMLGRLRIPFRDAIVSGAMIVMSVISWDAEPDSPRIPVNHKDRFLGSPIPHCWWFHKKSGKFTPSPLEGRLVVYIYIYPIIKTRVFDIASVVFRGFPEFLNPIPWHLRWAPFSLIRPCRSLEGIVLKNLRNTLRKDERCSTNQKTSPKTWGKSSTNLRDFTWVPKSNCRVKTGFNEFFSWRPLWKVGRNCN